MRVEIYRIVVQRADIADISLIGNKKKVDEQLVRQAKSAGYDLLSVGAGYKEGTNTHTHWFWCGCRTDWCRQAPSDGQNFCRRKVSKVLNWSSWTQIYHHDHIDYIYIVTEDKKSIRPSEIMTFVRSSEKWSLRPLPIDTQ